MFRLPRILGITTALLGGAVVCGLDWSSGPGFRRAAVSPSGAGRPGFMLLSPAATGVTFSNRLAFERQLTNQIYLNGSGVAAGDVDGDGWCDLYFCGLDGPNALYRNLGNWRFEEITVAAGVGCPGLDCTGAAFADLEGDGDLDLVVNSIGGGTQVLLNDGNARFTDHATLNAGRAGHSLALADIDGDGDLDLYVANYRGTTLRDMPQTKFRVQMLNGRPEIVLVDGRPATGEDLRGRFELDTDGRLTEFGEPDVLFRNDGRAAFVPVSFTEGAFLDEDGSPLKEAPRDWSLSAMFRDFSGDGVPDLYTCSDFSPPDRFWLNLGDGRFREAPRLALRTTPRFSMGIDAADINRDGLDDLFVSDMLSQSHTRRMVQVSDLTPTFLEVGRLDDRPQYLRNALQLNRGDGTYAEVGRFSGLAASEWTWCPVFLDVDLDGYEDALVTTGHFRDSMNGDLAAQVAALKQQRPLSRAEMLDLNRIFTPLSTPNAAFRNRGDLTFEEVGAAWGYATPGISQGQALADLDNDGDLDIAVNNLNSIAGLYRNESTAPRLAVRLRGGAPNTGGIGARILVGGGPVRQSQEFIAGGHYLSSSEVLRVFAAGSLTNSLHVEVTWRSGRRSVLTNVPANFVCEIAEAGAWAAPQPTPPVRFRPLFADVSHLLAHRHAETPFDDFARQPLLPRKLSQSGPGVAFADVDGDGRDDIAIGSGNGGKLALFLNDGQGGFVRSEKPPFHYAVTRDQTTVLVWRRDDGPATVLAGSANYEDGLEVGPIARQHDLSRGVMDDSLPAARWSVGPLALGDYDDDGDLDLFAGGQVMPGRYPEPADSLVLRNDRGRWVTAHRLERLGLVSGALFTDLTGDGRPELVVGCDWGALRLFRFESGNWREWDPPVSDRQDRSTAQRSSGMRLSHLKGWWTGIAAGDWDGDGRMDLVAGNRGRNLFVQPSTAHPLRLRFGDFDGNDTFDVLESGFDAASGLEVPLRGLKAVGAALPFVQAVAPTFEAFGRASVEAMLGDRFAQAGLVEVNTPESLLLLNRGDQLEVAPLPLEAQLAPVFAVCAADFDGDGLEDVFLGQNFFAVNPDDWRYDAGRALLLRGDGRGGLTAMPGHESALLVYGEQRGAAVGDFDADGRADLVVTQNGAETKLFHNTTAKPGLRVRLEGPEGNPCGAGAVVRLRFGERLGPAREVHGGGGYWSQDSPVLVMGTPATPTAIQVRWPGGRVTERPVPVGARETRIHWTGKAEEGPP